MTAPTAGWPITTTAERAAVSAMYWARPGRRDDDVMRAVTGGLTVSERAQAAWLIESGALSELSDDELLARMGELAAAS